MSYGYGAPPGGGGWDQQQQQQGYHHHHQYPEAPTGYAPPAPYGAYPPPPPHYDYNQQQPAYHHPHPHYPPPPPQHDPNQLHPPHDVGTDPNSFRRFLMATLQRLSFNSKPVITNLTLFAHEHAMRMSTVLAQTLEDHLKQCPPAYKLPALYLLDSISKNIGPPYLGLFSRFIERSFLQAYHVVDHSTKLKMEELLGTWRTGAPDGGELFRTPEEGPRGRVQRGIESALFGDPAGGRNGGENDAYQQTPTQGPSAATPNERSGVLIDIRRLLQQRQEEAVQRPDDEVNQGQISALTQLESLVLNTQLTSDQVGQIRAQLAALTPTPASPSFPQQQQPESIALPSDPLPTASIKSEPMQPTLSASYTGTPEPSSSSLPVPAPAVPPFDPARLAELLSPNRGNSPAVVEPTAPPPAVEQPPPPAHGIDLSLLAQLQGLGASGGFASLFAPAVPSPALAASGAGERESKADVAPEPQPQPPVVKVQEVEEEKEDPLVRGYDEAILALGVGLSNKEIMSAHPPTLLHSFLYASLPLQCKQCGLRFFNSKQGQGKMDGHLDWHFTHKRRVREGAGRAQGRSWLGLEEDWIHSDSHLLLDSDSGPSSTSTTRAAALAATTSALDRAALMKRKVPAPTDDPVKLAKPCPVCKEKWKAAFEEEEEEWVFWNAVEVEGVLYHATCHAEASASASRASTRLKLDASALGSARQSRENTPLGAVGEGGGGGSAKKRKAEDGKVEKVLVKKEEEQEEESRSTETDDPRVKRTKSEAE